MALAPKFSNWLRAIGAPEDPVATDTTSEWSAMSLLKGIFAAATDGTLARASIASMFSGVSNIFITWDGDEVVARALTGEDVPASGAVTRGTVYSKAGDSNKPLASLGTDGAFAFCTISGSGDVAMTSSPLISAINVTDGIYLESNLTFAYTGAYKHIYHINGDTFLQWNASNAYLKHDAFAATNQAGTAIIDWSTGGVNIRPAGGVTWYGSTSGTIQVVATATAGTRSLTLPAETGTFATREWVTTTILDAPPSTLDTLNELAAALGDDPNFATTTATAIGLKAPLASPTFTGVVTIPAVSANLDTTQAATSAFVTSGTTTFSNKTLNTASAGNLFYINSNLITGYTGSGANVVLATQPTITEPTFATRVVKGVYILGASGVASSTLTGTTAETTLATITVPANAMGANGFVRITSSFVATGAAGTRTLRCKFGGTTFQATANGTTILGVANICTIANRNSTTSQVGGQGESGTGVGGATLSPVTAAIDTTSAQNITITGQLGDAGDSMTLNTYLVELIVP